MAKYDDIDFKPPVGAANAAKKALEEADKKSASSPLRRQPDYGKNGHHPQDYTEKELVEELMRVAKKVVNPYLNTPPTELRRNLDTEDDSKKRKQMTEALNAWRVTVPGPFWRSQAAKELSPIAKQIAR